MPGGSRPCKRCREARLHCELLTSRRGRKPGAKIKNRKSVALVEFTDFSTETPQRASPRASTPNTATMDTGSPSYQSIFSMFLNNGADAQLSPFPFFNLGDAAPSFTFEAADFATPPQQSESAAVEVPDIIPQSSISPGGPSSLIDMKVISDRESRDLVELYWSHCHLAGPCLDPELHTYEYLRSNHAFLFNCVCAVAAKFYRYKIGLAEKTIDAVTSQLQQVVFFDPPKIETAQGLFLLSHWHGKGSRNYNRTWMIASSVRIPLYSEAKDRLFG